MAEQFTGPDALRLFLTGASSHSGAQTDPDASLGLHQSSTRAAGLSVTRSSPISNITINFIHWTNGAGDGTLEATGVSQLRWTAPGGSAGPNVSIANGETKILQDGTDPEKYIQVTRTSATDLMGTETDTLAIPFNDVIGFDNISAAERAAGDISYRCVCIENVSAADVTNVKAYVKTIGTQQVSDSAQLGASGAGTITISGGNFNDWPTSGHCRIESSGGTLKEIVYYSSRTTTSLTVPTAGRARLGTSATAGAATDVIRAVSPARIAKEAPSGDPETGTFTDKTSAGENSAPALTFNSGITAGTGESIGTLTPADIYAIWIEYDVVAGATQIPEVTNYLGLSYDAA